MNLARLNLDWPPAPGSEHGHLVIGREEDWHLERSAGETNQLATERVFMGKQNGMQPTIAGVYQVANLDLLNGPHAMPCLNERARWQAAEAMVAAPAGCNYERRCLLGV